MTLYCSAHLQLGEVQWQQLAGVDIVGFHPGSWSQQLRIDRSAIGAFDHDVQLEPFILHRFR